MLAVEVRLLGTGSADGWPNPWCTCASCYWAREAGEQRTHTAALVDDVLLLDCGPDVPRAATRAGVALDRVRWLLLGHAHPDHSAPAALLWRGWSTAADAAAGGPRPARRRSRPAGSSSARISTTAGQLHGGAARRRRWNAGRYRLRAWEADHGGPEIRPVAALGRRPAPDRRPAALRLDTLPLPEADRCRPAPYDLVLLEETYGDGAALRRPPRPRHLRATRSPRCAAGRSIRRAAASSRFTSATRTRPATSCPPAGGSSAPRCTPTARCCTSAASGRPQPAPGRGRGGCSSPAAPGPASPRRPSAGCAASRRWSTSRRPWRSPSDAEWTARLDGAPAPPAPALEHGRDRAAGPAAARAPGRRCSSTTSGFWVTRGRGERRRRSSPRSARRPADGRRGHRRGRLRASCPATAARAGVPGRPGPAERADRGRGGRGLAVRGGSGMPAQVRSRPRRGLPAAAAARTRRRGRPRWTCSPAAGGGSAGWPTWAAGRRRARGRSAAAVPARPGGRRRLRPTASRRVRATAGTALDPQLAGDALEALSATLGTAVRRVDVATPGEPADVVRRARATRPGTPSAN